MVLEIFFMTKSQWKNYSLEISDISTLGIIPSRQKISKALIRLHGFAGLIYTYAMDSFSHDVALNCFTKIKVQKHKQKKKTKTMFGHQT